MFCRLLILSLVVCSVCLGGAVDSILDQAAFDPCVDKLVNPTSRFQKAEARLVAFFKKYQAETGRVEDGDISVADFFPGLSKVPSLSQFNSGGDTLLYGQLLSKMLKVAPAGQIEQIVDLGAGSSIPTIKALLENPVREQINVTAVDIDWNALETSKKNVADFGLNSRYAFVNKNMAEFLNNNIASKRLDMHTAIVSNPPYLPAPKELNDPKFIPVGAGTDGTRYLNKILSLPLERGTYVALAWGSLSNPTKIISKIEKSFDVIFVQAYETTFGMYTSSDQLLPHILKQAEQGNAIFSKNELGRRTYTVIGTILRKR